MKGEKNMKYLRINSGKAEFLKKKDKKEYSSITEMVNTDVYNLLLWIGDDNTPEFDDDLIQINHNAERVVYENLLNKFNDFVSKKDELKFEIDEKFKPLEEKYL